MTARRYRVKTPYTRVFDVVPVVARGGVVTFIRRDHEYPGWFFGAAGSVEGYFPYAWFEVAPDAKRATALRDYDATELTVGAGDVVEEIDDVAGWRLVRAADGRIGWVPNANLEET
jgi:hypothetical protein